MIGSDSRTNLHASHPPDQPREAWLKSESPAMHQFASSKPPLPPVTASTEGGDSARTIDTARAKKSDKITEEWSVD